MRTVVTSGARLQRGGTPVAFVPIMFYNRERLDKGISMSKVVPIRPDMAVPAKEMEAEADLVDLFAPGGFVTTLNSVHITGPHMRAAVETNAQIPVRIRPEGRRVGKGGCSTCTVW